LFENYFEQFAEPEILRVPIEGIVLQMKSMNIDVVVNFPFPTPPDRERMRAAEAILEHLGALEGIAGSSHITSLGKTMSLFPLSPRFSKMLVAGKQYGCLPYVITIVSALSVGDPFLREEALGSSGEDKRELNDEDLTGEIAHIRSEDLREKEIAKARRRAFINSQQVSFFFVLSSRNIADRFSRPMQLWTAVRATSFVCCQSLVHMNLLAEDQSFAQSIFSDPRYAFCTGYL